MRPDEQRNSRSKGIPAQSGGKQRLLSWSVSRPSTPTESSQAFAPAAASASQSRGTVYDGPPWAGSSPAITCNERKGLLFKIVRAIILSSNQSHGIDPKHDCIE